MRRCVLRVLTGVMALGCNSISGVDDLQKVDCVGSCGSGGSGAVAADIVGVGRRSSCVILTDKTVRCWGANPGVLPGTVSTTPVVVEKLVDIDGVSIGLEHACAKDGAGTVWCWGLNTYGQLGDGTTDPSPEPKAVPGLPTIDTVTVGSTHSCAYTSPDTDPVQAWCWGQNDSGQLGNGNKQNSSSPVQLVLPSGAKVLRLGPGGGFTGAILSVGGNLEAWCWGKNDKGQCGQPTTKATIDSPEKVPGVPPLERVYPGFEHMCGRTVGTKIPWCWGANDHGQVGVNKTGAVEPPVEVLGGVGVDTMFVGYRHACLENDSSLEGFCWGANDLGQFGDAPSLDKPSPTPAPYLNGAGVSMRQAEHGCRVLDGVVSCFGANDSGQLGNGKIEPSSAPVEVQLGL